MNTAPLKKFAQFARRQLLEQVSTKLTYVLKDDSLARRENSKAVAELEKQIRESSREQVIEKAAYIWFNRFCAIRFMDANRYTRIGIVSPSAGFIQPEILTEAKLGHIDETLVPEKARQKVHELLTGTTSSSDPQTEAYRHLLVAACNYYHSIMPFLFERIADYTELLLPDDLLSENSILTYVRETLYEEICRDVEVIGWLYQFYISEKKDEVFDGLKKNKKITPKNIPAATQLFTPHWIVRYLVENSLGRLWMLNRPNSRLIEQMDYYIKPETPETDFLRIGKPEEIKLCDPACGSGHMLTYSYDLLYSIYEEEGYDANDIPRLILKNNLFGIEIDERAGELAAFALTMKAANGNPRDEKSNHRRFFRNPIQPNICVLQNVLFEDGELKSYMDAVGRDLFTVNLQTMLHQFREADNFGSLIRPEYADAATVLQKVEEKNLTSDLFLQNTHIRVLLALRQAEYLSSKYHVVVANPPYMGGKGMNGRLGAWAKDNYPDSKSDLFAMFIERGLEMVPTLGYSAMVTMESWMFLSSYEKLRSTLLEVSTLECMVHMPYLGKGGTSMGINFGTCATIFNKAKRINYMGQFCYVRYFETDAYGVPIEFPPKNERLSTASVDDFKKIPGSPIAYWVASSFLNIFKSEKCINDIAPPRIGMMTTDNNRFLRYWFEVDFDKIGFNYKSIDDAMVSSTKWFPYNKGGNYRKWAGNSELIVNWYLGGHEIKDAGMTSFRGKEHYFKEGISWGDLSSTTFSCRYTSTGKIFDIKGTSCFPEHDDLPIVMSTLNSKVGTYILKFLNPTISFQSGDIRRVPIPYDKIKQLLSSESIQSLITLGLTDWDFYETSWGFVDLPLLRNQFFVGKQQEYTLDTRKSLKTKLGETYRTLRIYWQNMTLKMQQIEEDINHIFIETYNLQSELTPEVPLNEITLTCNPHYRYGSDKSEVELESLLLADTMREFISHAVGCMFGRYSLDKPGLILANQGETVEDYLARVPNPTFEPDDDNVIPILDEGWFIDDITERFRKFLKVTFGEEHYEENLRFIEEALGKKGKRQEIRDYFLKDFYPDHLKRYKKRPIYWLFSSPKGSFNALIYMHRYRPDTVSVVLNDYLREFRTKLSARKEHLEQVSISASASPKEKTQALKDLEKLRKVIDELEAYERETLYPLATKQIAIDLDDGVKVNYLKFGDALKKIPGLDAGEE